MYFQVLFIDGGVQKFITVSKNDMKIFLPNLNEHSNIFTMAPKWSKKRCSTY